MHLYDSTIPSGNGYKVQLALTQLGVAYSVTDLDILATPSETRSPAFLAKNPNGRIPVLVLDDGRALAESNAILCYLAQGTPLLPEDRFEHAQCLQWMFFEQYSHERFVAVLKFWTYWGGLEHLRAEQLQELRTRGQQALDVMQTHLADKDFFVGGRYSVADIALFAYTQSAEQIGLRVGSAVQAWLQRVRQQPRYKPIKADPTGRAPLPPA